MAGPVSPLRFASVEQPWESLENVIFHASRLKPPSTVHIQVRRLKRGDSVLGKGANLQACGDETYQHNTDDLVLVRTCKQGWRKEMCVALEKTKKNTSETDGASRGYRVRGGISEHADLSQALSHCPDDEIENM